MRPLARSPGRPKAESTKQAVSIRLSPEVVAYFKAGGTGWQTHMRYCTSMWLLDDPTRRDPEACSAACRVRWRQWHRANPEPGGRRGASSAAPTAAWLHATRGPGNGGRKARSFTRSAGTPSSVCRQPESNITGHQGPGVNPCPPRWAASLSLSSSVR
ncbi:BrnA antitoxin family protein [Thiohalocapsa sp. ML1]|uniref:BrnA antitoxin family protein n=1 Tax=Thiohalocapsa sp. ML1 TaxID=1431688 RepID=UPI0020B168BA|nr:BrnA antitoxin family protein [Thiohalocapsa sp. ML1]